jgi:hypothetical protein
MFGFLAVGPLGGLVTMVTAVWLVLRRGRGQASLGGVAAVVAGIVALAGAAVGVRLLTIDTYSNEAPPRLEFEIRLPATMRLADRDAVRVELHTDRNVGVPVGSRGFSGRFGSWNSLETRDFDHQHLKAYFKVRF